MQLEAHPAACIFPMEDDTLQELADDIREHGQKIPVEIYQGQILDGRRRYKACQMAKVDPECIEVAPKDPIAYVLSLNLKRRHLDKTQRAMVAARVKEMYEGPAKERQVSGGTAGGKTAGKGRPKEGNQDGDRVKEIFPEAYSGQSRDKAGEALGVSGKLVDAATSVLKSGDEKLIAAVEKGEKTVSAAAKEVKERKRKPKPESNGKPEEKPEPEPLTDEVGVPVSANLLPVWAMREKFREARSLARKLQTLLADMAEGPGGEELREVMQLKGKPESARWRHPKLEEVDRDLKFAEPYSAVCAYCHHEGKTTKDCRACKGRGWQTKMGWQGTPKDYRAEASGNPLEAI